MGISPEHASQDGVGRVSGIGRVIVGASGSPGSVAALRHAEFFARGGGVMLQAVHAWLPPGGDLAERRSPSPELCRLWEEAARQRLKDALFAAWGTGSPGPDRRAMVRRGEPGPVLAGLACCADDLLVVGAGKRGAWPGSGAARSLVTAWRTRGARCWPFPRRLSPGRQAVACADSHTGTGN